MDTEQQTAEAQPPVQDDTSFIIQNPATGAMYELVGLEAYNVFHERFEPDGFVILGADVDPYEDDNDTGEEEEDVLDMTYQGDEFIDDEQDDEDEGF